jgi:DMSO/TMAO reductase YedYZ molybdopterin-dependent catalytic subunit
VNGSGQRRQFASDVQLPPNQQLIRGDRWPVVGERGPRNAPAPWSITIVRGDQAVSHRLESLRNRGQVERTIDVHCVTRWSRPAMRFRGVPLLPLLEEVSCDGVRFVSFTARSEHDHSTSLPLETVIACDPLIAFEAEGEPLSSEHGGPVRLVVPGRYFYKSIKWLQRIELLAEDRLGTWEADAGYHNEADPWKEQRYMAPSLSKQQAKRLLESKDFRGQELRGIIAAGRDLTGLDARRGLLRAADFSRCLLRDADFRGANLSNAIFHDAVLCAADLRNADCEGADFSGADLRGADLRGASLFGASFCVTSERQSSPLRPAAFDRHTRLDVVSLDALTDDQRGFVLQQWSNG